MQHAPHENAHDEARSERQRIHEQLLLREFQVSGTMVGLCITGVGVLKAADRITQIGTLTDDLLAVNALLFMLACFLSLFGLRMRGASAMEHLGRWADTTFLVALGVMVMAAGFLVIVVI